MATSTSGTWIPFDAQETDVLSGVDEALAAGVELLRWWRAADAAGYPDGTTFPQSFVFNRPQDRSYGFFDTAPLSTGPLAVNGNVQRMFYDEPKSAAPGGGKTAEWMNEQVREFVLHYFMRISDYRLPQQFAAAHPPPPPLLELFSQCPSREAERAGFGFVQKLYRTAGGELGRFRPAEQDAIVDLRRLGPDFEWIVLRNPIFDFSFQVKPFGDTGPQLVLPISQFNFLVTSKDFVVDQQRPEKGVLGRYGFGYAFIRSRTPSPLAYGPGQLEPAFETLVWDVLESGQVRVQATFVANQPTAVLNLSIDPITWSLELAGVLFGSPRVRSALAPLRRFYDGLPGSNLRFDPVLPAIELLDVLTLGQSSSRLCISKTQIMKEFLYLHFIQHYQTILGSLQTWRQVGNWLDEQQVPPFARDGRSS